MPTLRSPDGAEEIEVPDEQVEHYLSLGATLVPKYTGAPDEPLEAPPWWLLLDPVEYPGMMTRAPALLSQKLGGMAARSIAQLAPTVPGTIRAGAQAVGSAASRVASGVRGNLGKIAGRFAARRIPGLSTALDVAESMRPAAKEAGEALASAPARPMAPSAQYGLRGEVAPRVIRADIPAKAIKPRGSAAGRVKAVRASKAKATEVKAAAPTKSPTTIVKEAPGSAASRVSKPRGQSGPALERRAKMLEEARRKKGRGEVPEDNLEELLQRSIDEAIARRTGT